MGWKANSRRDEETFEACITESHMRLNEGDVRLAKIEYQKALEALQRLEPERQTILAPRLWSLFDLLRFTQNKSNMHESLMRSQGSGGRLNKALSDMYGKANKIYLNFLLEEREYSKLLAEIAREKGVIDATKKELEQEWNKIKDTKEQLRLRREEMLNDESVNAEGARPSMDPHELILEISRLLESGDKEAALRSYNHMREIYRYLSQEQKNEVFQKIYPKIRELI